MINVLAPILLNSIESSYFATFNLYRKFSKITEKMLHSYLWIFGYYVGTHYNTNFYPLSVKEIRSIFNILYTSLRIIGLIVDVKKL